MNKLNLVITGASSNIGSEVARRVASSTSNILLMTSNKSKVDIQQSDLLASAVYIHDLDLTLESATSTLAESAGKLFSEPFCWLHSVGDFWHHRSIEDTSLEEAVSMIMSHYVTLYATAKVLIPVMKNVGGGRILAFSCNSVRYNYPEMAAFTSAKAAVECFIRCIANEYLKENILANCLVLPTIATPKVKKSKLEKYHKYYIDIDKLVDIVIDCFIGMSPLITGTTINLVKYSPFFYTEGYYTRNKQTEPDKSSD